MRYPPLLYFNNLQKERKTMATPLQWVTTPFLRVTNPFLRVTKSQNISWNTFSHMIICFLLLRAALINLDMTGFFHGTITDIPLHVLNKLLLTPAFSTLGKFSSLCCLTTDGTAKFMLDSFGSKCPLQQIQTLLDLEFSCHPWTEEIYRPLACNSPSKSLDSVQSNSSV